MTEEQATAIVQVLAQYREDIAVATEKAIIALVDLGVPRDAILPRFPPPSPGEEGTRGSDKAAAQE